MTEQAIHVAVAAHLNARGVAGMFWWHTPNGGFRRRAEARILAGLGVKPGVPDIAAVHAGQFYALELKTEKGKLSSTQIAAIEQLQAAGAICRVAYGLDDAIGQLESWGLLRGRAA